MGFTNRPFSVVLGDVEKLFMEGRNYIEVCGQLERHLVGGQPANDEQLKQYIQYWLKIDPADPEFKKTYDRIKKEEIGHAEPEKGEESKELEDKKVYGINCLRKDEKGVYILNHMVQAMIKQTASRLGLMMVKKGNLGAKGDLAEMGKVHTLANIKENPKVNVLVFNPATRTGMRIWGTAQIVESGYLFDAVRSAMAQTMKVDHVVKIKVEEEMPLKLG